MRVRGEKLGIAVRCQTQVLLLGRRPTSLCRDQAQGAKGDPQAMSRTVMTIGVLFALSALGAISASSADAVWFINGSALTGEAALLTKAHVVSVANLTVPGLGLRIECIGEAIGEHALLFSSET